jgi:NhaA family Na+:H+ antiporter
MADHNRPPIELPKEPIHRFIAPIDRFMHIEAASGVVLVLAAAVALVLANSQFADAFLGFWHTEIGFSVGSVDIHHSLQHWINDGLMAIFFFVVGLEIKRELVTGELRDIRRASLPLAAAIGGMIVPALIYLALIGSGEGSHGWGIPMATDIAFVVGCMALLGRRVPLILRVMILSLAIVDDIGAILVIAIGYTDHLNLTALLLGIVGIGIVSGAARVGVRSLLVYTILGLGVWFAFEQSGIHATIAGVILGLMTPARAWVGEGLFAELVDRANEMVHGGGMTGMTHRAYKVRRIQRAARETIPPIEYLESVLHPWVSFGIMPLFALANAGVPIQISYFGDPIALAVMAGLVVGKPIGVMLGSWIAVRAVLKQLPEGLTWGSIFGGGVLAGIGFTMALFIAELAKLGSELAAAKVGILTGSAIAAIGGMFILIAVLPKPGTDSDE